MSQPLFTSLQDLLGDRYRIERELGRGGMGAVYLARDRQLERPIALKVLPPEIAGDEGLRERFLRETRMVAGFSHPNIVPVFAVEESPDLLAFAMGYVEGESLSTRVQRAGPLSSKEGVRLLQDIGYALAYAHGRGVVHRDLKPDNIMIERATGRSLLMDFGIARTIDAPTDRRGLTRVGEVVGTPEFMSPEQAVGDVVDGRSDLYSLALVAYYALTGTAAITGDSAQRVLVAQLTQPIPSVGTLRPDLPAALVALIDQCAAKEPSARFASAEAMVDALDATQLAAPDVALPIRELGEELDVVPLVVILGTVFAWMLLLRNAVRGWDFMDGVREMSVVVAMTLARLAQVRVVRRRLTTLGYDAPAVYAGLVQLYGERAAYRAALRLQPGWARRQRRMYAAGAACMVLSQVLTLIGNSGRTQIGTTYWIVPAWVNTLYLVDSAFFGVGVILLLKTPLTALRDTVIPRFWLGPVGRWLLSITKPQVATADTMQPGSARAIALTATPPAQPVQVVTAATSDAAPDLSALRAAVRTLEAHIRTLESPPHP